MTNRWHQLLPTKTWHTQPKHWRYYTLAIKKPSCFAKIITVVWH